jgi:class 3 adenylate cyclase
MKGIAEWLASIGLSEYAQRFTDNAIDLSVIRDLTEQDLKDLGVLLGHRRKILRAIAELDGLAPAATETATEPVLRDEAERRHLTVMICDLVGSTALSARLDPEDMRAVIDAYHAACARITRTYDGFLAEFRGDGILAYFGYPRAHEDDAESTVRAGLDIIAAVARLETRAAEPLAVRIGIATGLVVVGDPSGKGALREHALVGDTPNLAARLQALAEPGTIVVAASTRRLLGDLFRLRDLGRHEVKGIAEPVAAWAVEGVAASESRFEAVRRVNLTDLVGREDEIDFLLERQRVAWTGGRPDRADLGRAGDREVPPCGGSRRAHRRQAAYALALPMFALPHQQRASSVHCPVRASGRFQGRRYVRAMPRQVGSGPRHGRIAD